MAALPEVAVIIVTWNSGTDIVRCLDAVAKAQGPFRVIVVDNGSEDGTVSVLRERYPDILLIENDRNLGYTGGNNMGIERALALGSDFLLLLNDDAVVAPDAIMRLLEAAQDHPDAGLFGPSIYAVEHPEIFLSAGGSMIGGWLPRHRGLGANEAGDFSQVTEVDFISGCALFARREAFEEIGGLDDRFFVYHEDIDWCYRAKQAGFKALAVPTAKVWHPDTRLRDAVSPLVTYYITRNTLAFLRKHRLYGPLFRMLFVHYLPTLFNWTLRDRAARAPRRRAMVRALSDFARGIRGPVTGWETPAS
ncbi:MAG: glycosyltransferase family 2 protein [Anaerolineae bacterium]|nr:glycosyltransferase family 2 protein [Anaerolineae bacterium]